MPFPPGAGTEEGGSMLREKGGSVYREKGRKPPASLPEPAVRIAKGRGQSQEKSDLDFSLYY
jgi:hypothetical protein